MRGRNTCFSIISNKQEYSIPSSQLNILKALAKSNKQIHGGEISRITGISENGIYVHLKRLEEKKLVQRNEGAIKVCDITLKRVFYTISEDIHLIGIHF